MQKMFDVVRKMLEIVVLGIFGVIIVFTIIQVFMRYVVRSPITWYDEFVRFLLIWGTLLGCALATHYKKHIGMDLLVVKLPTKARLTVSVLVNAAILALCVFYIVKGGAISLDSIGVLLPTTHISKLCYYGAVPVGALFWAIFNIEAIIHELQDARGGNAS